MIDFHLMKGYQAKHHLESLKNQRLIRLIACAFALRFEFEIKSRPCIEAVKTSLELADFDGWWPKLYEQAKAVTNAIRATKEDPKSAYAGIKCQTRHMAYVATMQYITGDSLVISMQKAVNLRSEIRCYTVMNCICQDRFMMPVNRDVRTIATEIYKTQDFGDMPILADALEDAGCTNQDVLQHCRSLRDHWRGCFVLDSLRVPRHEGKP